MAKREARIERATRRILRRLSYGGIEIDSSRKLANIKAIDPLKIFYKTVDYKVDSDDHDVPVRIYFPDEDRFKKYGAGYDESKSEDVILFFHGGGWVTESVETYNRICARMAQSIKKVVISVDYRLAPEYRFPAGLNDCYEVARRLYAGEMKLGITIRKITIMGDSAGGNLAAAVSLMAKERGEFMPKEQILIYPATNSDYSENSPFDSVRENGTDYLLTARKMEDYINLYVSDESDKDNPLCAPIKATDLSDQPKTLILTAEHDPLRDEGEAYGTKLKEAGNDVYIHRITGAMHGFFALGIRFYHVQESFDYINEFLKEA